MQADIGVVGLAVMGQNLILNMNDHGFNVVAFNRTISKVDDFINGAAKGTNIQGAHSIEEMVGKLAKPRKVMLMVKAGEVVDRFIEQLLPHMETGDIIIDGGNSNYQDTNRRCASLKEKGIRYVGAGVSGGEEGARQGPSLMPGGDPEAWPFIKPIFQAISAKTDAGEPCCDWVGEAGAGHFVKMVHNGIEYGDMQLICESYDFMQKGLKLDNGSIQEIFKEWNKTELDSYLIEITADILGFKDSDGSYLVDNILDMAGQKGTGKWTGINALDMGIPLTLITESVYARCISALKEQRIKAQSQFNKPDPQVLGDQKDWLEQLRQSLLASKIISYAQGFMLMKQASDEFAWNLNLGNVALMWRGGCIIRSMFLNNIRDAFASDPALDFLGMDKYFKDILNACMPSWRKVAAKSIEVGIPTPTMNAALIFLDGYASANLPANLIQAQRDYFGAHTYERKDKPRGEFFHTDWTGCGGDVASSIYNI